MPYLQIRKRVNKLLTALYLLMLLALLGSLGFAMVQNWQLKLASTRSELARHAGIGNFIVENAIIKATQSLTAAQRAMTRILNGGPLSALQAHEILQESLDEFNASSNSSDEGLLLLLGIDGQLLARTGHYPAEQLQYADQAYFQKLLQGTGLERTVSALSRARTTGQWVFHVAMPLRDSHRQLRGVLVQQIRATDIARDMDKYVQLLPSEQLVSQSSDAGLTFIHPPNLLSEPQPSSSRTPYADFARRSTSPQDAFVWPPNGDSADIPRLLVGYEHSENSGLLTTIHLPLSELRATFIEENLFLLGLAGVSLGLITGLFLHLYRLSNRLNAALNDAFCDTLTTLPNRRAFDDMFPRLLREAMRSRQPLSVLFIDIDHFKHFNDDYGHDGGDVALHAVAQGIRNCAARPLDFVCRWGGEEFVVILPHTSLQAAELIAERTLQAARALQLRSPQGQPMRSVSVSIGLCSDTISSVHLGMNMVSAADEAMQQAKHAGRDRCISCPQEADAAWRNAV